MLATLSTCIQIGLTQYYKLLPFTAAATARETGKGELNARFREGHEWVPHRGPGQGSQGGKAKGARVVRTHLTTPPVELMAFLDTKIFTLKSSP